MHILSQSDFKTIIKHAAIKPRFKRDLKFVTGTESLSDSDWKQAEMLAVWNKSKKGGVLLLQPADKLYIIAFDDSGRAGDANGRIKPIICDFCYTWQPGFDGGFATFYPDKSGDNSVSMLCCADFDCSRHARGVTLAAKRSRAQIREQLSEDARVERLKDKLTLFIKRYQLDPIK